MCVGGARWRADGAVTDLKIQVADAVSQVAGAVTTVAGSSASEAAVIERLRSVNMETQSAEHILAARFMKEGAALPDDTPLGAGRRQNAADMDPRPARRGSVTSTLTRNRPPCKRWRLEGRVLTCSHLLWPTFTPAHPTATALMKCAENLDKIGKAKLTMVRRRSVHDASPACQTRTHPHAPTRALPDHATRGARGGGGSGARVRQNLDIYEKFVRALTRLIDGPIRTALVRSQPREARRTRSALTF